MGGYRIVPVTGRAAIRWVAETHRRLPKLQGALFAVGVEHDGEMVGVATAGNPARVWQGTGRFIITRCAALPDLPTVGDHAAPACSMLYSALCNAGLALGYSEAWTYTEADQDGRSLLAAGFIYMGETSGGEHGRKSRPRGPAVNAQPKGRWAKPLTRDARGAMAASWLRDNPDGDKPPPLLAPIVRHLRAQALMKRGGLSDAESDAVVHMLTQVPA